MVNILFLNKFREIGGSEVFLLELLRHLDRSRFRPVLVPIGETSPEGQQAMQEAGARVYPDLFHAAHPGRTLQNERGLRSLLFRLISPQGRRSPYDIGAVFRLARILREEQIHILMYLDKHAALNLAPLAALLARTPVVIGSFHTAGLHFSLIERMLLPLTGQAVVTSHFHQRYLADVAGFPAHKIQVIYNGLSLDRLSQGVPKRLTKAELGLPDEAAVIGSVARLVPEKNHPLLFKAAALVLQSNPNTHFILLGDGPERANLENLRRELGLENNIHFLGYRSDVGALLRLMDISVLSSDNEWLPYSLLEAMLTGLPVVATDVGAISELVTTGETGLLAPKGDAQALAQAMSALLHNRELARRLGQAGQRRVRERFSSQAMAGQFETLFEERLAAKRISVQPANS